MRDVDVIPVPSWHTVESGDRWYQAVLRFTAPTGPQTHASVRRWQLAEATDLISWERQDPSVPVVVLWEMPADSKGFLWALEGIATLRRINRGIIQLAHLPTGRLTTMALVVQEAGVTFLLDDLWTLESIVHRLAGQAR